MTAPDDVPGGVPAGSAGTRMVLVPDLDGDLLAPLGVLEEVLLSLGMWEDDDRDAAAGEGSGLQLPAPLADRVALAAVQRIAAALAPTQSRNSWHGRQLAPDGRYEHAPLTVLELDAADIATLSATAAALGHPALDADVVDLVAEHAAQLGDTYRRVDRTELVSQLARLAGVLDLQTTAEAAQLTARLQTTLPEHGAPGVDLVFTAAEEAAYNATADRINAMWAHGSGIDRYQY